MNQLKERFSIFYINTSAATSLCLFESFISRTLLIAEKIWTQITFSLTTDFNLLNRLCNLSSENLR